MARPRRDQQLSSIDDAVCDERTVHLVTARSVRASLPQGQSLTGMADLFSAPGDPTRLRIVAALAHNMMCVGDLATAIGPTESAVSHHLWLLRSPGFAAQDVVGASSSIPSMIDTARVSIARRLTM